MNKKTAFSVEAKLCQKMGFAEVFNGTNVAIVKRDLLEGIEFQTNRFGENIHFKNRHTNSFQPSISVAQKPFNVV